MKRLLLLGGSRYLLPVIEVAHKLGCYVVTCDYLPDNIAHKYSDEYCNISIIEKDTVLETAKKLKIDGIMSFACDPGVVTAAYVAEKMDIPFQGSYESVKILQDKGLFRKFLADNHFNTPYAKRYTRADLPVIDLSDFQFPVIVKPVDSAGSKGVTKVNAPEELNSAIKIALGETHNDAFIIEEFITFQGYHSSADSFTVNGKLQFVTYSDQLFDPEAENQYTPARIIFPSIMSKKYQDYLTAETQRLMNLLHMETGIYNIESCVGSDGKPYIMEVSPRGGGCKIAEIQQMAMQANLIENEIRSALGLPLIKIDVQSCDGFWCEMVIHARHGKAGILKGISIEKAVMEKYVKLLDLSAKPGDIVKPFTGANMSLGDVFLRFNSREELETVTGNSEEWLHIEIEE